MSWLFEHWLRFAEKINGAIFSFVFFWGTIIYLYHFEKLIYYYLEHLEHTASNHGYSTLQLALINAIPSLWCDSLNKYPCLEMFSISGVLQIFSRRFCYKTQNYWQVFWIMWFGYLSFPSWYPPSFWNSFHSLLKVSKHKHLPPSKILRNILTK